VIDWSWWIWLKWITKENQINNCNKHDMSQTTCQMLLKVIFWCTVLQEDIQCCTHTLVPHIKTRSQKSFMIKLRKNISCSSSIWTCNVFSIILSWKQLCQKPYCVSNGHKKKLEKMRGTNNCCNSTCNDYNVLSMTLKIDITIEVRCTTCHSHLKWVLKLT
jgi:hypothetical protein